MAENEDQTTDERPLRWIANPLNPVYYRVRNDEESLASGQTSTTNSSYRKPSNAHNGDTLPAETDDESKHEPSLLRTRSTPSPSELFYDLFFAAAFGTFTDSHTVDDSETLKAYVAFFAMLWITWMNVGFYDLRLARDSVFDRVAKAAQFTVMAGFTLMGTGYDVSPYNGDKSKTFFASQAQELSFILMMNRWVLVVQYLSVVRFAFRRPDATAIWRSCLALAAFYTATASSYLVVAFFIPRHDPADYSCYIAWFVLAAAEMVFNIGVCWYWPEMNFKHTHIVDRMSTLTLIILGEGVIVLFNTITDAYQVVAAMKVLIPPAFAAMVLLYLIYMVYFDRLPSEHFNFNIEPTWAVLHFPLHLAIVIAAYGSRFFLAMSLATQSLSLPDTPWNNQLLLNLSSFPGQECYAPINVTIDGYDITVDGYPVYDDYFEYSNSEYAYGYGAVSTVAPLEEPDRTCANNLLLEIASLTQTHFAILNTSFYNLLARTDDDGNVGNMEYWLQQVQNASHSMHDLHNGCSGALQIMLNSVPLVYRAYDLNPPTPEYTSSAGANSTDTSPDPILGFLQALDKTYIFVYGYYTVASGCILLFLSLLVYLSHSKGHHDKINRNDTHEKMHSAGQRGIGKTTTLSAVWGYVRWSVTLLAGATLCLLAVRVVHFRRLDLSDELFMWSLSRDMQWVNPTVTLIFFAVLLVEHLRLDKLVEWVKHNCSSSKR